jgi:hypothetical protein
MPRLEPNQIRTGVAVGDIIALEDAGGTPTLPALDARQLVNVPPPTIGNPKQKMLGSLLDYRVSGSFSANEVQYTQVYLLVDQVIEAFRFFIDRTTGGTKQIRMGLYDQADPDDVDGVPQNRLVQTGLVNASAEDVFTTETLGSPLTITTSGYYWIAVVRSSGGGQFQIQQTDSYPADFLPVRRQSTASTALPASASGLSNPASAVVLAIALEQ